MIILPVNEQDLQLLRRGCRGDEESEGQTGQEENRASCLHKVRLLVWGDLRTPPRADKESVGPASPSAVYTRRCGTSFKTHPNAT